LRLRVERLDRGNPVRYDGEKWYHVEDIQLGTTGVGLGPPSGPGPAVGDCHPSSVSPLMLGV